MSSDIMSSSADVLVVTSVCLYCKWSKDITVSQFKDPDLTKCFVFKTCPQCPKCQRLLQFRSPKRRMLQSVHPIPPKDVDSIMKSYLKRGSTLTPIYNFEKKCVVGTKIMKGIRLDPSELSYLYGVREPFEFHSTFDCNKCEEVHNLRAVYMEENTGNTVKLFMDDLGLVERLQNYLSESEMLIIPSGECIICLDTMNDVLTCKRCDKCEKQYHKECIQQWIKKSKSCPHCRQSLESAVFVVFAKNGKFYSFFEGYNYNKINRNVFSSDYYSNVASGSGIFVSSDDEGDEEEMGDEDMIEEEGGGGDEAMGE